MSRTIGDRDGKKGGVISEPEVSRIVVADTQPGFRITLASDGLWDAASVKQGKYFPFTTFRRLIAHTRLTLFFLQSSRAVFRETRRRRRRRGALQISAGKGLSQSPHYERLITALYGVQSESTDPTPGGPFPMPDTRHDQLTLSALIASEAKR